MHAYVRVHSLLLHEDMLMIEILIPLDIKQL